MLDSSYSLIIMHECCSNNEDVKIIFVKNINPKEPPINNL